MNGEIYRGKFIKIDDKYDSNGKIIPWFKLIKEIEENNNIYTIDAEFEVK